MIRDELCSLGATRANQHDLERHVFNLLKEKLSNKWAMITNILLPAKWRDNAPDETDLILIGPPGVYSMEAKWWTGELIGGFQDAYITQMKRGGYGSNTMPNPVKIANDKNNILVSALRKRFTSEKIRVTGGVVFPPRDQCTVKIQRPAYDINMPLLNIDDAIGYFIAAEERVLPTKKSYGKHIPAHLSDDLIKQIFEFLSGQRSKKYEASVSTPINIGNYMLTDLIEETAQYRIYLGHSSILLNDEKLKIKELRIESSLPDADYKLTVDRLLREARALAALRGHPHVLQVYPPHTFNGKIYVPFEYVEGITLADIIESSDYDPIEMLKEFMLPVLDLMSAAHSIGVMHRGLRPTTIIRPSGAGIKVTDFTLARTDTETASKLTKMPMTPYDALEIGLSMEYDFRVDVYALGAICYEILTGCRPPIALSRKAGEDLPFDEIGGGSEKPIPTAVKEVITKATGLKFERRYDNAGVMRDALIEALNKDV